MVMLRFSWLFFALLLALPASAAQLPEYKTEIVAQGLEFPWALEFLPNNEILVTERPGRLRIVRADGALSAPIRGVPAVQTGGQDGLLDVMLDPNFAENRLIYFTYAEPQGEKATLAVARALLEGEKLSAVTVIFRQTPVVEGHIHFGSRLAYGADGYIHLSTGDRYDYKEYAQRLDNTLGKVVRFRPDGTGAEIFSYGHRNMQALAFAPDGSLYGIEHGARGGDELNRIERGKNYGWPVVTYSRDYTTRLKIGQAETRPDVVPPIRQWTPSVAPSGMLFYSGKLFPQWQGDIFMGTLAYRALKRLRLQNGQVIAEQDLLGELEQRIRDVKEGPEGAIYVLTDSPEGQILRLTPLK
jgi:aldose sugar dehydrogenase